MTLGHALKPYNHCCEGSNCISRTVSTENSQTSRYKSQFIIQGKVRVGSWELVCQEDASITGG